MPSTPHLITMTGNGTGEQFSAPYLTNWRESDPAISLGLDTDGSTTEATVQHSFDANGRSDPSGWTWFDHPELAAITAKADGNYAFPVTAIRLKIGATGTDVWKFWIVESG